MGKAPQGRKCPVCTHASRSAIEQAILNGKSATATALAFGLTYTNAAGKQVGDHKRVNRHRDRCMPDAYEAAMSEAKNGTGARIASRIRALDEAVDEVLTRAREGYPVMMGDVPMLNEDGSVTMKPDGRMVLAAVREARANAEMLAKLSGAVPEEDQAALDKAREAIDNPEARRLIAEAEDALARAQQEPKD